MTAKEYLLQVNGLDTTIEKLGNRIDELYTPLLSVTADPSREHVDGSKNATGNRDAIIDEISKVRRTVTELQLQAKLLRTRIQMEILDLDDPVFVEILTERYIEHKKLKDIQVPKECPYEYKYLCKRHNDALLAFAAAHPEIKLIKP